VRVPEPLLQPCFTCCVPACLQALGIPFSACPGAAHMNAHWHMQRRMTQRTMILAGSTTRSKCINVPMHLALTHPQRHSRCCTRRARAPLLLGRAPILLLQRSARPPARSASILVAMTTTAGQTLINGAGWTPRATGRRGA